MVGRRSDTDAEVGEYLVADNIAAVVSLTQMGIVEDHTWNPTDDDVERPNRFVWDLDPGPEVAWKDVVAAAKVVRAVLRALALESWVKTTGGRGLHVVMPITPARDWSECLEFSRAVSEAIERTDPQRTRRPSRRAGANEGSSSITCGITGPTVHLCVLAAGATGSHGLGRWSGGS